MNSCNFLNHLSFLSDYREIIQPNAPSTDCPTESEFSAAIEKSKKNPPERCKGCWIFRESKFYEKPPVQVSEGVLKLLQEAGE